MFSMQVENSPNCLLQIALGVAPRGFPQCKISKWLGAAPPPLPRSSALGKFVETRQAPPFVVFSAGGGSGFPVNLGDLGLEKDAARFVELLERCGVPCHYHVVPGCHHGSICWTEETHDVAAQQIRAFNQ